MPFAGHTLTHWSGLVVWQIGLHLWWCCLPTRLLHGTALHHPGHHVVALTMSHHDSRVLTHSCCTICGPDATLQTLCLGAGMLVRSSLQNAVLLGFATLCSVCCKFWALIKLGSVFCVSWALVILGIVFCVFWALVKLWSLSGSLGVMT